MKLYPIPGGTWAATESDWKAGMRAAGLNPKDFPNKFREVPTNPKGAFIEWLTFNAVDVYRLEPGSVVAEQPVDIEALRAKHNPGTVDTPAAPTVPALQAQIEGTFVPDLDALFVTAPIPKQVELAVGLLDRLENAVR